MFWKKNRTNFLISKNSIVKIPIKECIHYCGFMYGNNVYNPYETYVIGIANNEDIITLRKQFIQFLMYYRPCNCADALDINLSRDIALWTYPWDEISKDCLFDTTRYWFNDLNGIVDLLTHFSNKGILSYRIDEEFTWLERALFTITNKGFLPDHYTKVLHLKKKNKNAYLVLDGNHRISALTALGIDTVPAKIEKIVSEENIENWFAVKNGFLSIDNALNIFNAYFKTNNKYVINSTSPAKLIAPKNWMNLYNLNAL